MDPIRQAGPADAPRIAALFERVKVAMHAAGLTHWDAAYPGMPEIARDVAAGTAFVLGDEPLLAAMTLDRHAPPEYAAVAWRAPLDASLYVHRLAVDPALRRQGLARRMMAFAEARARGLGLAAVKLDAYRDNPGASGLYPALGYTHTGEVRYPPHPAPFLTFELLL
ncbi:MAG: GNAT family N-acetyltransferase [Alphaproteobacteria bacterium]|nr:GNAT family N-acetyltransferase [Alphaproteobacteria bacterium]